MRAALLPTPGDPFMLAYWLRNYATWREHVDELVVYVNGQRDPDALAYDRRIVEEAGGRFLASELSAGHDGALRFLLDATGAEHVVLCEDDAYVRHPEAVGEAFRSIEEGETDIVGSPRHEDYITSPVQEWGPYTPGDLAELRHGLWPAFLFIERRHLQETDRWFGDRGWHVGTTIDGWGTVTPEACAYVGIAAAFLHLDTLFGTTFQLRAKGLRTTLVHHVRLYDAAATEAWLAEDPPWFHVTGLSTLPAVLNREPVETLPDMDDHGGLWVRRVAWWWRVWHSGSSDMPRWNEWMDALDAFVIDAGIRGRDVRDWSARFEPWVETWAPVPPSKPIEPVFA